MTQGDLLDLREEILVGGTILAPAESQLQDVFIYVLPAPPP